VISILVRPTLPSYLFEPCEPIQTPAGG
jgi:hypothetical protein